MAKKRKKQRARRIDDPRPPQPQPADDPEAPLPLLKVLLYGALIINGMTALSMGIAVLSSEVVAFVICVLLALVTIIGGSMMMGLSAIYATILSFLGVAMGGLEFPDYLTQRRGEIARGISVTEVPRLGDATRFYFEDAEVARGKRVTFTHVYYTTNSTTKTKERQAQDYTIAPLVPSTWVDADPIPAWVICEDPNERECVEGWSKPYKRAVKLLGRDHDQHLAVRSKFLGRHKALSAAKGAPFLRWTADPEAYLESKARLMWGMLIAMNLLWFLVMPAARLYTRVGESEA